jgi:putative ABC transport system permease protein
MRLMLWDNVRFSVRSLAANPGFSLAAILALGIGIGLNATMFSVVDGILLKPLPFNEPDRIVQVRERFTKRGGEPIPITPGNFYDYRQQSQTADMVAFRSSPVSLLVPGSDPERYFSVQVAENWFRFFGIPILRGRDFSADDYRPGNDQAIIISYGLWTDRFAAANDIIGRQVNLNGRPRVIVGVAAPGFEYPGKAKLWSPLVLEGQERTRRDLHNLVALGRLKPGVAIEQARTEFTSLLNNMAQRFPQENSDKLSSITFLVEDSTGPVRPALVALLGAVGFVLAIACANVANLLLARGASRSQELAIRVSLGASRWHLISQLLTESFVLATAGGAVGLGLAWAGWWAFRKYAPPSLPRVDAVSFDSRVLLFGLAAILVTSLVFGLIPALRLSRVQAVKGSTRKTHYRDLLVVAQVAAALVLMTGAGLLIRSLYELSAVDLGFNPSNVISMRVTPLPSKYATSVERQIQFGRNLTARLKQVPGVEAVGLSTDLPLQGNPRFIMRIEGRPPVTVATAPIADYFTVTPGYYDAMKVQLKRGRIFSDTDQASSPLAVVVNEEFVKRHMPNEDPIGKRLEIGLSEPPNWRVIVGVVGNVKNVGVDKPTQVQVYGAFFQGPGVIPGMAPSFSVIGRTKGDPAAMAQDIRRAILEVDNSQPVWNIQTLTETVNTSLARERFTLFLMAVFAGIAFVLALIGLTGLMSYTVTQRTREIGIRMAIGARPAQVLWMIERQGLLLVGVGLAIGTVLSLALSRYLTTLLYATSPNDPLVFIGVSVIFLLTALVSGWLPARRAAMVHPAITLRAD